jgi:hypothetical protein
MAVQSARVPAKMYCVPAIAVINPRPRNPPHAKAAPPRAKSSGRARKLVSLVGALETLIVHLHALDTRAARLSIPTRYSAGS